jgi:hypothetical protein
VSVDPGEPELQFRKAEDDVQPAAAAVLGKVYVLKVRISGKRLA